MGSAACQAGGPGCTLRTSTGDRRYCTLDADCFSCPALLSVDLVRDSLSPQSCHREGVFPGSSFLAL